MERKLVAINGTIGSATTGSEKMLTELHELKRTYDQLPASVQAYIASTLISTLTRFISEGEAERRNINAHAAINTNEIKSRGNEFLKAYYNKCNNQKQVYFCVNKGRLDFMRRK